MTKPEKRLQTPSAYPQPLVQTFLKEEEARNQSKRWNPQKRMPLRAVGAEQSIGKLQSLKGAETLETMSRMFERGYIPDREAYHAT